MLLLLSKHQTLLVQFHYKILLFYTGPITTFEQRHVHAPCMKTKGKCYRLYRDRLPWEMARSMCRDYSGIIAAAEDEHINTKLIGKYSKYL